MLVFTKYLSILVPNDGDDDNLLCIIIDLLRTQYIHNAIQ